MNDSVHRRTSFLLEVEQLKAVLRKNTPVGLTRNENAAEHSWHTTLAAMLFAEGTPVAIDVPTVLRMLLIHDIVEVDAGEVMRERHVDAAALQSFGKLGVEAQLVADVEQDAPAVVPLLLREQHILRRLLDK